MTAKRQAAESSMHGICFFYTLGQLIGLHYLQLPEFRSYLLQYGNKDLSFTLQIYRPRTAAHLKPRTDGRRRAFHTAEDRCLNYQPFTSKTQRSVGFSPNTNTAALSGAILQIHSYKLALDTRLKTEPFPDIKPTASTMRLIQIADSK